MYSKVVLPLDGSKLAETALPHLEAIAGGCKIPEIHLVSVTEKIRGRIKGSGAGDYTPPHEYHVQESQAMKAYPGLFIPVSPSGQPELPVTLGKMARTAAKYLQKIARQLEEKGFTVKAGVLAGNPAEEILSYAENQGADLIVIASRGKSGFSRWDMGNIAEKVLRAARVPVLLVKPPSDFKETRPRRKGAAG